VIVGIAVLAVGLFAKFDPNGLANLISKIPSDVVADRDVLDIPSLISSASLALIIGGAFFLIIGFLGCCGAWKEVSCFLIIYMLILVLLIIMEFAFVVVMFVAEDKVKGHLLKFLTETLHKGYVGGTGPTTTSKFALTKDATTLAWDMAQFSLECCGANDYKDYKDVKAWDHTLPYKNATGVYNGTKTVKLPYSCCKVKDTSVIPKQLDKLEFVDVAGCTEKATAGTFHDKGCYEAVKDKLTIYFEISACVGIGIALLEIFGLVCACILYNALKKNQGYEQQK